MRRPKAGVVVFPGSNCDRDTLWAFEKAGFEASYVWHRETDLRAYQVIALPGGFSYGDYLRPGALAAHSPVVKALGDFKGYVIGICNGFQVLTEAHILPGALTKNLSGRFICQWEELVVANNDTPFTNAYERGEIIRMPIAHSDGRFVSGGASVRPVLRYLNNPNGSEDDIAAIISEDGRFFGTMPHPERASDPLLGGTDGLKVFVSLYRALST
ncbi:MAG: phosphoribosylformylglycinamidine synthase subunit PurQ [Thermotogae bacterium]|nr:phosphoribosylformylglycinamidine synthase subunit PurQ [Thermotogota bacterium]